MRKPTILVTIIGVIFSVVLGSMLHFLFDWSGNNPVVASIAAVNESTWEHIKIGFWPLLVWAFLEYFLLKVDSKNFFIAKAVTIMVYSILIPLLFYLYTAILGDHVLFLDIGIFMLAIFVGQFAGYNIMNYNKNLNLEKLGLTIILMLIFSFVYFTYYPLERFLFQDPVSRGYGIIGGQ